MRRGSGRDGLGECGATPACTVRRIYADSACNQVGEPGWGSERCGKAKTFPVESRVMFKTISSSHLASESKRDGKLKPRKRNANNRFMLNVRRRDSFSVTLVKKKSLLPNLRRNIWMRITGKLA